MSSQHRSFTEVLRRDIIRYQRANRIGRRDMTALLHKHGARYARTYMFLGAEDSGELKLVILLELKEAFEAIGGRVSYPELIGVLLPKAKHRRVAALTQLIMRRPNSEVEAIAAALAEKLKRRLG